MQRFVTLSWWARGGLYEAQRWHQPFALLRYPEAALAANLARSSSLAKGAAARGTAPGSDSIAFKCDNDAMPPSVKHSIAVSIDVTPVPCR